MGSRPYALPLAVVQLEVDQDHGITARREVLAKRDLLADRGVTGLDGRALKGHLQRRRSSRGRRRGSRSRDRRRGRGRNAVQRDWALEIRRAGHADEAAVVISNAALMLVA